MTQHNPSRRSLAWFADRGKTGCIARSHTTAMGLTADAFGGRPIVGIAGNWPELTTCNAHLRLATFADVPPEVAA